MSKNKITAILVMVCMCISFIPQISFARSDMVCNLSTPSAIMEAGFPASGAISKTGDYSLKWADSDLYRNIEVPTVKDNWTGYNYLEFYMYSKYISKSKITVGLISDNPETKCLDYYIAEINVNWSRWKLVSLCFTGEDSVFTAVNSPLGFDNIQKVCLWPTYGGKVPVSGSELYVDSFYVSETSSASETEEGGNDIYMLADYTKEANIVAAGLPSSTEYTLSGPVSLKWAGEDYVKKQPRITDYPTDWSEYQSIVMTIYSANANNASPRFVIMSNDPETDGDDYFFVKLNINWTGWKTIALDLNGSVFSTSRTPLGWDNINGIQFWTGFGGVAADPTTVLYIDQIYLSKVRVVPKVTIEAVLEPDFYDASSAIKEKTALDPHPRLLLNEDHINNLKSYVKTDAVVKRIHDAVISKANIAVNTPVFVYEKPDGLRLERTAPDMMPTLALAYLISGDIKYKDRLWSEVNAVCSAPDWNPTHMLDVGDFSKGVAYAYDWLYDVWTSEERAVMENAIVRCAFGPVITHLRQGTHFAGLTNNWNQVINSGVGIAALAIADIPGYEDIANEVINRTVGHLPKALETFAPDGASPEGPSYWSYAKGCFFQYVSSLFNSMGYDFGLSKFEAMDNTGYFPIAIKGPTNQVFNFGDGGPSPIRTGIFYYLAQLYDKPEFGGYMIDTPSSLPWTDLAMYRQDDRMSDYRVYMPLDKRFRGIQELASMRSSWNDGDALFVAFKGGNNSAGHNDLDLGSFVLDALGNRFIMEFGSDYYEAEGMWDYTSGRWKYYRKNTEGQNTLVINPTGAPGQNVTAVASIETFESSESAAYGILNLTEAYSDYARSVKRGFGLINNRSIVLVQDEITTSRPSEIYSFFHTMADIEISADKKQAILTMDGDRLQVDLISEGGEFMDMDATPLPTSLVPPTPNMANPGVRKLAVHMTNAVNPTIAVTFTPLKPGQQVAKPISNIIPLSSWETYKTNSVSLTSLSVDNVPVTEFTPANTIYNVGTGIYGTVSATTADNANIEITQAQGLGDTAFVKVTSNETGDEVTYSVSFKENTPEIFSEGYSSMEIKSVEASAIPEPQNIPENTYDGSFDTKWAAEGDNQWIAWDLGEKKELDSVLLSFAMGDQRSQNFEILVSKDGKDYTSVYNGSSSGKTTGLERFTFDKTTARFVKFISYGNTVNKWVSLTEVNIPPITKIFEDTVGHWAEDDISLFASLGFVNGISDTLFSPDTSVTRAEFLSIVARCMSIDISAEYSSEFSDVSEDDWYAKTLKACKELGIIPQQMYSDGNIYPEKEINREEMVSIIVMAYESACSKADFNVNLESLYSDFDEISDYAKDYIASAVNLRLVKGIDETHFSPKSNTTRAEAVVIIKRLLCLIYN